ncbi:hypothetical protein Tco_1183289 [Tanacetum coccineum]
MFLMALQTRHMRTFSNLKYMRKKSRGSNSGDGGNTGDEGKTVVGAIGIGEMVCEAELSLDESYEGSEEVFPGVYLGDKGGDKEVKGASKVVTRFFINHHSFLIAKMAAPLSLLEELARAAKSDVMKDQLIVLFEREVAEDDEKFMVHPENETLRLVES